MKSRIFRLKVFFYAPVVIALLRCLVTFIIFVMNPQNMSLRFLQIIPVGVLLFSLFTYLKLYSDGDPVISLLLPTILHFIVILVFKRSVEIIPFLVPLFFDGAYLVVKGIKASLYPFEIEGEEEEEDDFQDLEVGV